MHRDRRPLVQVGGGEIIAQPEHADFEAWNLSQALMQAPDAFEQSARFARKARGD
jgi:hypothetical protein